MKATKSNTARTLTLKQTSLLRQPAAWEAALIAYVGTYAAAPASSGRSGAEVTQEHIHGRLHTQWAGAHMALKMRGPGTVGSCPATA